MKSIVIYLENLDKDCTTIFITEIIKDRNSNYLDFFSKFVADFNDKNYRIIGIPLLYKNIKAIHDFNLEDRLLIFDSLLSKKEIRIYDQQIKNVNEVILNFFKE